jgi:hypothetical protein
MAALADLVPANGATAVTPNAEITFRVTDGTGIDPDLVTVEIDGVETDRVFCWNTKTVSGGSVIADTTDVYFAAWPSWWSEPYQSVTVEVFYNTVSLGSATWTGGGASTLSDGFAVVEFDAYLVDPERFMGGAGARIEYVVAEQVPRTNALVEAFIGTWGNAIRGDLRYYVAHYFYDDHEGSLIVAAGHAEDHEGSLLVHGTVREDHEGSLLVQGFVRTDHEGMLIVGVEHSEDHEGSFLVALPHAEDHEGSLVVRGCNWVTLTCQVVTEETRDAYADLGVTYE